MEGAKHSSYGVYPPAQDVLLDHLAAGVLMLDRHGSCTYVNAAALELIGCTAPEVLGKHVQTMLLGSPVPGTAVRTAFWDSVTAGESVRNVDLALRTASGNPLFVIASSSPIVQDGELRSSVVTLQDGSPHRRVSERLHLVEHEQAEVLRQRDAAARVERELVQETANRQRELTFATERAATEQLRTQQKVAEDRLLQSEKLAAVGRLAASISHEINNPLEAVTNLLYLVKNDPSISDEASGYLKQAEEELGRVSQIVSQTLRFQRSGAGPVEVGPEALIHSVLTLHQGRLHHKRVRINVQHRRPRQFLLPEGDVRQILNNLVGNAIDAMSSEGGVLTVRTAAVRHPETGEQGLRITVCDTGSGMDRQTASRIFEPFYTTKGSSGSGLGLWISGTLAKRNGGRLTVRSATCGPCRGTSFSLFLPERTGAEGMDPGTPQRARAA